MLSYKRSSTYTLNWLDLAGIIIITIILTAAITYTICKFQDPDNHSIRDTIETIAKIATAFAFSLAFWQFRKNSITELQTQLFEEAKSQIDAMIEVSSKIKTGSSSDLQALDLSMKYLLNHALNFDEIYSAMNEGIQKSIIRMRWQDMYFNSLQSALISLGIEETLKKLSTPDDQRLSESLSRAEQELNDPSVLEPFRKYYYFKSILKDAQLMNEFKTPKLTNLNSFIDSFLTEKSVQEYLYGTLNKIDYRAIAPLLAAIKDMNG